MDCCLSQQLMKNTMNLVQSTEGLEKEKGCNYIKISGIKENKNTQMILGIGLVAWSWDGRMTVSTQFKKARSVWKANDWG